MNPHIALTIPEILTAILQNMTKIGFYVSDDEDRLAARRDLLSAALCCTAFKDPSLNILWSRMDTILPLLKLIPGMNEIRGQMVFHSSILLNSGFIDLRIFQATFGVIDPNDLTVFYSYARRIMHCAIHGDISSIEASTCAQLSQLEYGLLPSLTSIDLDSDASPSCLYLLPVLLPALVRSRAIFSVSCYTMETNRRMLLDGFMLALAKHVNVEALQHLTLSGTLHPEYVSFLSDLFQLQSASLWLSTESWTFEIIEALSSLGLNSLHIDFESADSVPKRALEYYPFSALTTLSLTGKAPLILYILNAIAGDRLESIVIFESGIQINNANAKDQAHFYKNFGRFTSLRKIKHHIPDCIFKPLDHRGRPPVPHVLPVSIIHPLLRLKHLNVLELQFPQPWYQITDRDLSNLAIACPLMEKLLLYPVKSPRSTYAILPTFESLVCLAKSSPSLIELDMSINMGKLSPSMSPVSFHRLQKLTLHGTFPVDSSYLTARLLDRLFPHLTYLFISEDPSDQISRLVFELCQPARKDEQWRRHSRAKSIKSVSTTTYIDDEGK